MKGKKETYTVPKRQAKTYDVTHAAGWSPGVNYNFIILPFGISYNGDIRKALPGDMIRFTDGSKKKIYDICLVKIGSSLFRNLCRYRYGRETEVVLNQWRRTATSLGYAPSAVGDEVALVIWYKEDDKRYVNGREIPKMSKGKEADSEATEKWLRLVKQAKEERQARGVVSEKER